MSCAVKPVIVVVMAVQNLCDRAGIVNRIEIVAVGQIGSYRRYLTPGHAPWAWRLLRYFTGDGLSSQGNSTEAIEPLRRARRAQGRFASTAMRRTRTLCARRNLDAL
jgi:hypothetical protein